MYKYGVVSNESGMRAIVDKSKTIFTPKGELYHIVETFSAAISGHFVNQRCSELESVLRGYNMDGIWIG